MPPQIRVEPSSLLSTSSGGSLLDGAYTAGVAYASPLRRGQMSPRLVLFLAVFTTLVLLVSNSNSPATVQPPLENQTFMEDHGPSAPSRCCLDIIPWVSPPRYQQPLDLNSLATTRIFLDECPRDPTHIEDGIFSFEETLTNLTDSLECSVATPLLDSMPTEGVKDVNWLLLAALSLLLMITLLSLRVRKAPPRHCELSRPPQTLYTNNPATKSFVDTWDPATDPPIPATSRDQLHFPEHEEVFRTINELAKRPSNNTPLLCSSTRLNYATMLRHFLIRMWSCGMEFVAEFNGRIPVEQGDVSDSTLGTSTLSPAGSTYSFDVGYEDYEVEEIGIDYYS